MSSPMEVEKAGVRRGSPSPPALAAERPDVDEPLGPDRAQVARAVSDLQVLGHLEARLEPDGDVVGDVVTAQRQHRRVERRAVEEEGEVGRAGADVSYGDAQVAFRVREDRLRR